MGFSGSQGSQGSRGPQGSQAKFTDRDRTSRTEERGVGERALYTTLSPPFLPTRACSANPSGVVR